jgi:hypothetical protein
MIPLRVHVAEGRVDEDADGFRVSGHAVIVRSFNYSDFAPPPQVNDRTKRRTHGRCR